MNVNLAHFDNKGFDRGRPRIIEFVWRLVSALVFQASLIPLYSLKRGILRCFGAKIGKGVVIKPRVFITFPWKISVGDFSWIGEEVRLESLAPIQIGSNVCISQRVYLCTGSHDITSSTFDLLTKPIVVEDGAWIGAASVIGPGVRIGSQAFVTLGSIVTKNVQEQTIVSGNPASERGKRELRR